MTCGVLHVVRVQMDAVAGSEAVWVLQILTKQHRRYRVDINTLCRQNLRIKIYRTIISLLFCMGVKLGR